MEVGTILTENCNESQLSPARLESLARQIKARGLSLPVRFILESHLPLAGVFSNLALLVAPTVAPLLGLSVKEINALLSSRDYARELLILLQEQE